MSALSCAEELLGLPEVERQQFLGGLTDAEAQELLYRWEFWARPKQLLPEGDWRILLYRCGRGFGKTRTGAELVRRAAEEKWTDRIALVGATAFDTRSTMVEGESGILAVCPPWFMPHYQPSRSRLIWPNGVMATMYSAEEPARLRGPQHGFAWGDELAVWRHQEAFDNLAFGLRLGDNPRSVYTTTPKRSPLFRYVASLPGVRLITGGMRENIANLPPAVIEELEGRYAGTSLGRQELDGELLDDNPEALWQRETMIDRHRVSGHPELKRVVVGIDPSGGGQSECGIVVAGLGVDDDGYVLEDRSLRAPPARWAEVAVAAYEHWSADCIAAETNYGGAMVEATIRTVDRTASYKAVTATRGKQVRAEPVAALYEQGRVHHVGCCASLEDELCNWVPGDASPNRLDALVWTLTELMLGRTKRKARFL